MTTERSLRFHVYNHGDLNALLAILGDKSAYDIPENVPRTVRDISVYHGEVSVRKYADILHRME